MVNKVILLGRLGRDPEVIDIGNGVKKASFSIATNEVYRDRQSGEKKEITDWHNLVLWRRQAEVAEQYLHKGDLIYVEGRLKTRKYTTQDNVEKYVTEVLVDNFQMLSTRPNSGEGGSPSPGPRKDTSEPAPPPPPDDSPDDEDDLPF